MSCKCFVSPGVHPLAGRSQSWSRGGACHTAKALFANTTVDGLSRLGLSSFWYVLQLRARILVLGTRFLLRNEHLGDTYDKRLTFTVHGFDF